MFFMNQLSIAEIRKPKITQHLNGKPKKAYNDSDNKKDSKKDNNSINSES